MGKYSLIAVGKIFILHFSIIEFTASVKHYFNITHDYNIIMMMYMVIDDPGVFMI